MVMLIVCRSSRWRRAAFLATCYGLAVSTLPAAGQIDSSQSCLAHGATVYSPGDDHVKAPKFQVLHGPREEPVRVTSRVVFDIIINSAGRICEIHVVKAPDRETARQL